MASFRHLVILLRHAGSSPLHANNVSHSLNLLPKALSKKCHRFQRASQFPESSPVKSALHYILPLPHDSLSLLSCHGLIFFLLTFQDRTCQRSSVSLPRRRNIPQILAPLNVSDSQSQVPVAIDLLRLWEERQRAQRQDDTPAESSINTIPGNQRAVSAFLPW